MSKEILDRMKSKTDLEYIYPVSDCSSCGEKDIPFGIAGPFIAGGEVMSFKYCLNCNQTKEIVKPKGYVSLLDLEETDLSSEL